MKAASNLLLSVDNLGRRAFERWTYTLEILQMTYLSFRSAVFHQAQGFRTVFGVVSAQIYFTGWQAFGLITTLAVAIGSVVIIQSSAQLTLLGGWDAIGNILVVIVVRELAPLMVALVVIARSGTAVASEIGNMRVNNEIEALETMGIDPLSYIVFPRIVGGVISVICLTFYFNVAALLGGYVVAQFISEMPFEFYTESLSQALTKEDVWIFLSKNIFSGIAIFAISCYQGLKVGRASFEVPVATIRAVMNSIVYVVFFNLLVTALVYLQKLIDLGVL